MAENVYMLAFAAAVVYIAWKVIEVKYVRKSSIVPKSLAVDACSVFVSVVVGSFLVSMAMDKTKSVVGVFTSEPGF